MEGRGHLLDGTGGRPGAPDAAWSYPEPTSRFVGLTGWIAFFAQRLDCEVDGEAVDANEGAFYGGWITSNVVGPFKGGAGTSWW